MKIKTNLFDIEIEILFFIVTLISFFSTKVREITKYYYLCYLFIVFHEMAHILVGSVLGKNLERIHLSLSGVNAKFKEEKYVTKVKKRNYLYEILIYIAGPISNIIFATIFINIRMVYEINIFLAFINLIPIYPLDGYNIMLNVFYAKGYDKRKIRIVSKLLILILSILAVTEAFMFKNFSFVIFTLYIYVLNISDEKIIKNV